MAHLEFRSIEVLISLVLGCFLVLAGLWMLVFRQTAVVDQGGNALDITIKGVFGIKTASSAVGIIVLGGFFIEVPVWTRGEREPRLEVSGLMQLHEGTSVAGISHLFIGVVPTSSHATSTLSDGRYSLKIPKGAQGETYQVVAQIPNSNPPQLVLGKIDFDADGRGTFDHVFHGRK